MVVKSFKGVIVQCAIAQFIKSLTGAFSNSCGGFCCNKANNSKTILLGVAKLTAVAHMYEASCTQHAELGKKLNELEQSKNKLMMYGMVGMAFIAGLGWTGQLNLQTIFKFFGV